MSRELEMLLKYPHCHLDNERCVSLLVEVDALKAQMQQARADALKEAAKAVSDIFASEQLSKAAVTSILALIGRPQEGVRCEWIFKEQDNYGTRWFDTGCGCSSRMLTKPLCPYCGKPIKIKE